MLHGNKKRIYLDPKPYYSFFEIDSISVFLKEDKKKKKKKIFKISKLTM